MTSASPPPTAWRSCWTRRTTRPRPRPQLRARSGSCRRTAPGLMKTKKTSSASAVHGVLVVDKPAGPTSHDIVDLVRRALGTRRVGHTGTLDPFASGVLPVCVGKATRLVQFLAGGPKVYRATVRLGFATIT